MIENQTGEYQGGFVAVLHSLEEQFYGPGSPINAKGKILLYIRHRLLRDWETGPKHIGKSEIVKALGMNIRTIERALDDLVKDNILAVYHNWDDKQWGENQYKLHPSYFGKDIVYNGVKKPLKLLKGGKESYPPKTTVYPQQDATQDPPTDKVAGSPHGEITGRPTGEMTGRFPIKSDAKPFLKNPEKELFPKNSKIFPSQTGAWNRREEMTPDELESRKRVLLEQFRRMNA